MRAGGRPRGGGPRDGARTGRAATGGVGGGHAEVVAVPGTRDEWLLRVGGTDQSHVDLADPTHLAFDYVRWIGHVADLAAPPGEPLHTAHVGAGAATLARYLAATRPGSRQVLLDPDAALLDLVRDALALRASAHLRVRAVDGREGLAALPPDRLDLVIRDAFAPDAAGAMAVPAHLATEGFAAEAARALSPGGVLVANLTDRTPFALARGEAATLLARWRHVAAVAEPATLRGRRGGNVVLVAADRALAWADLARRLASGPVAARLLTGADLRDRLGGARPRRDGEVPPPPPPMPGWR